MNDGRVAHERLGRPELAPLVDELARRFGDGTPPVAITVRDLSLGQRLALADLFGDHRLPDEDARVRIEQIVAALRLSGVAELRSAIEMLRGPIVDRRLRRTRIRDERDELWAWLASEAASLPLFAGVSPERWVSVCRAFGARGGVERHRRRLDDAVAVLRALPADDRPLAGFADDVIGEPHALDRGRTLTAIVLDAIAVSLGRGRAADAESARLLWEAVGVVPDPLSSTVLVLGLRPDVLEDPLAHWLRACAGLSEPVVLTLAQLRRWRVAPLPPHSEAYVVENPSLIADAAGRGWRGPVLVCSSGRPTIAVLTLLRQLGAAGATLYQHADFDPAGLSISAWLAQRAGTSPWRMTAGHYAAAVEVDRRRLPLVGSVPETPWDPRLRDVMTEAAVAVYEEELRVTLLDEMLERHLAAPPRQDT